MSKLVIQLGDTQFDGDKFPFQLQSLDNIFATYKPDYVIHHGDLWERGEAGDIAMPASTMVATLVERLTRWGVPWHIAAGNHDYAIQGCGLDFFHHPLVTAYKQPTLVKLEGVAVDFLFVPWEHGRARETEAWIRAYGEQRRAGNKPLHLAIHADLMTYSHKGRELVKNGSAFCLDPRIWETWPNTTYWAGHIHMQYLRESGSGYTGATWPRHFGETEMPGYIGLISNDVMRVEDVGDLVIRYLEVDSDVTGPSQFWEDIAGFAIPKFFLKFTGSRAVQMMKAKPKDFATPTDITVVKPKVVKERKELRIQDPAATPTETFVAYMSDRNQEASEELLAVWEKFRPEFSVRTLNAPQLAQLKLKDIGRFNQAEGKAGVVLNFTPGVNVLTGRNGRGKTTLLESVPLCLYGKFPDDRLIGEMTYTNARVSLTTTDFRLFERGWQKPKYVMEAAPDPKGHTQSLREEVTESDYNVRVKNVWGSQDVFFATSFVSQRHRLDIVRAKPASRMEVLRELFGLMEFDQKHEAVQKECRKYHGVDMLLKRTEETIEEVTQKVRNLREEVKQTKGGLAKVTAAVKGSNTLSSQVQAKQAEANQIAAGFRQVWNQEIMSPVQSYRSDKRSFEQALIRFKDRAAKAGCLQDGKTLPCPLLEEPLPPRAPFWVRLGEATICPDLGQPLPQVDFTHSLEMHRTLWAKFLDMQVTYQAVQQELQKLRKGLEELRAGNQSEHGRLTERLARAQRDLVDREDSLQRLLEEERKLKDNLRTYAQLSHLEQALGPYGLPQWWLEQKLPELEDAANKVLANENITDPFMQMQLRFDFSAGKSPKLEIFVEVQGVAQERRVEVLSDGQRALVSLAIWLAVSGKVLLLDEPFVGLHPDAIWPAASLIHAEALRQDKQVIVVTHEPAMVRFSENQINVELF